jgi:ribosomal protein S18 acetylase RimI-like enzyme
VAMSVARGAGCRALLLEVDRGNEGARRLYGRHGFEGLERDLMVRAL